MEVKELYQLEIEGIRETINDYAVENFIKSYTKQLKDLALPQDKDLILEIIHRLVSWYDVHMNDILQSKFIINKAEHQKAFKLLSEFEHKLV